MSHFGAPASGEEEEEPLEARMAREMALLEESLSALQASVGALGAGVRTSEELWADDGAVGSVLPAPLRPAACGALAGALGVVCQPILFNGYRRPRRMLRERLGASSRASIWCARSSGSRRASTCRPR